MKGLPIVIIDSSIPFACNATRTLKARVESSAAIAGGRVYVASNDGRLYVIDLQSGKKIWEWNAGAPLSAFPAVAGGKLVIGAQDGRSYCFG